MPGLVTGFGFGVNGATLRSIIWNIPTTGGSVADYQIQRRTDNQFTADGDILNTVTPRSSQSDSTAIPADTIYFYRVRARHDMDTPGPWSSVISTSPTADAGADQAVTTGATFSLTGDGTDEGLGDSLTYAWTVGGSTPAGIGGGLSSTDANPTFTAPAVSTTTEITFNLITSNTPMAQFSGPGSSAPDSVTITVNPMPIANAGGDQNVSVGATVTLSGTAIDADTALGSLMYEWTIIDSAMVTVNGVTITLSSTHIINSGEATATFATTYIADGTTPATVEDPTNLNLPSGTMLTFRLTVSGGTATTSLMDEVIIAISGGADEKQVATVVSEVARAIVSSTVSAVTSRISNVGSGGTGAQVAGVNVSGLSLNDTNMASALTTNAQAFATNSDAMKTLLGNSTFSLPLNAVGNGGGFGSVGIWASGEYSDLSGESDDLDWDGELTGFHLGVDGKIRTSGDKNILIGLAVSSLNGDLDYENNADTAAEKGNYEIDMTTVSPYIGWRAGVVDLWASVGFGEGKVELSIEGETDQSTSDAEQTSFAIGGSVADMIVNKNYSVKLKGELSASEFEIDDSDDGTGSSPAIAKQTLDATRARISVEASRISDLENGKSFEKSAEIGARFDGGDGETGAGVEIGGKLKYAHSVIGFTAEGSARILLGHSGDYQEWGIQGTLRKQVGRDGQGLSFHLTPAYGDVNSGVQQLLTQGLTDDANNTANPDYHMNLTTRLGYGIAYRGMVTPYTEMVLGTTDQYRMGINWKPNQTFNLTLLGEQAQQNAIHLQGAINF